MHVYQTFLHEASRRRRVENITIQFIYINVITIIAFIQKRFVCYNSFASQVFITQRTNSNSSKRSSREMASLVASAGGKGGKRASNRRGGISD